jgi:hypothetical protein
MPTASTATTRACDYAGSSRVGECKGVRLAPDRASRARQLRRLSVGWRYAGSVAIYGASSLAFKRGVRVRC